jgi:hypothetical protein
MHGAALLTNVLPVIVALVIRQYPVSSGLVCPVVSTITPPAMPLVASK